jgi:hypothetical protein
MKSVFFNTLLLEAKEKGPSLFFPPALRVSQGKLRRECLGALSLDGRGVGEGEVRIFSSSNLPIFVPFT